MRTKNSLRNVGPYLILASIMLVLMGCSNSDMPVAATSAGLTNANSEEKYLYPVRPGSEEWKKFQTHDEMLAAVQIPQDKLKTMSTEMLVDAVLDYPLFIDLEAFRGPGKNAMDTLVKQFNGLQELMRRPDASKVLLDRFQKFDPGALDPSWSEATRGDYRFRLDHLRELLLYPPIFSTLSRADRETLVQKVFSNIKIQAKYPDVYGPNGESGGDMALLMAVLQVDDPDAYQRFQNAKFAGLSDWFTFMRGVFHVTTTSN